MPSSSGLLEGAAQLRVAHAGVVVTHVADDDVADLRRIDTDRDQPVARWAQEFAGAPFLHRCTEPGVEN